MNSHFEIISCQRLENDYHHLTLQTTESLQSLPGEALFFDDHTPFYIFNSAGNQVECIIAPEYISLFKKRPYIFGKKKQIFNFPALHPNSLHVLLCHHQSLAATIFFLRLHRKEFNGLVIIETNQYFSFAPCPSPHLIPQIPNDVMASLALLNDWNIANRLTCHTFIPGCFEGSAQQLFELWRPFQSKNIQTIIVN